MALEIFNFGQGLRRCFILSGFPYDGTQGRAWGTDDWILEGITWAVDSGARVISLSLGKPRKPDEEPSVLYESLAAKLLNESPGVLLIAAAGNGSSPGHVNPVDDPAACDSILAVSAIDENWKVAPFSCGTVGSYGRVDLAAPGVEIYSTWTNNGFKHVSGTSMATPHVAGIATLYLELDPNLSPAI
jgi:subtilisin